MYRFVVFLHAMICELSSPGDLHLKQPVKLASRTNLCEQVPKEELGRVQEMLWCVNRAFIERRARGAAERAASVKLPLLTRNEALEKSLVDALGFEVEEIARCRDLTYVKVRMNVAHVLVARTCSQEAGVPLARRKNDKNDMIS